MTMPLIVKLSSDPAVQYAAAELRRCLRRATGADSKIVSRKEYQKGELEISLGLFSAFPANLTKGKADSGDVDEYAISAGPEGGLIAASNCRSVLLGVYRYLTELGFRWVRPGSDGESVPRLKLPLPAVRLTDRGSYRHRGVCIEGAVSEEHVRDMVDWLPKMGCNCYFIQFREGYNFFQRWYEHTGNPYLKKRRFSPEAAREMTKRLRTEIKKRGLELHMVGHGWTCEPFGIPGTGWFQHEGPIPRTAKPYLAEVKGERKLFGGIALNTNLCYGNPKARKIITEAIVKYAKENPDVDVLHFWLADGTNNQCECPLCRDHRPSDLYVRMLNDLDARLTAAGIATRIVFLVYVDLLWSPLEEKIRNPDRFLLMFAPITRSYSQPFAGDSKVSRKLPPYKRNQLTFPSDPQLNLAFLRKWQAMFKSDRPGDSFDFDYHFMWDHFKDPGYYEMATVLHQDIQRLQDIGLNGFVSCQEQRVCFPTGFPLTVLGRTLWNRDLRFDALANDYFPSAFGAHAEAARRYCETISKLFNPRLLRGEVEEAERKAAPGKLAKVKDAVAQVLPAVRQGVALRNPCHAASWRYLQAHTEFALLFAGALAVKFAGKDEEATTRGKELFDWARRNELKLQSVFDVFEFQLTTAPLLGVTVDE